jgi:hypothetical protein
MEPLQDVLTESNGPRVAESDFFKRPPSRSYQFILSTITLLLALAIGLAVLIRHWNELQTMAIFYTGMATVATVLLWLRVCQIFQRLHEQYSAAKLESSFVRSPMDKVFRSAGDLMSATLYFAFLAALYFLFALGAALSHHKAF